MSVLSHPHDLLEVLGVDKENVSCLRNQVFPHSKIMIWFLGSLQFCSRLDMQLSLFYDWKAVSVLK